MTNMNTKEQLIEHLENETRVLQTPSIKSAFCLIDRSDFVPQGYLDEAYEDYPLPIGFGQTISQPTTVAFMMELLDVRPDSQVLDVGSGSGYTTALLAAMASDGEVLGIEIVPELAETGEDNLSKYDFSNASIEKGDSKTITEDGQKFDRILVSAAGDEIPKNLFDALRPDGIMVVPVGQSVYKIVKRGEEEPQFFEYPGFAFVPLQ
jgi:protein-L-isoaspartate(D-aspartate) O-methyltransferase